jgi:hypothetical protein
VAFAIVQGGLVAPLVGYFGERRTLVAGLVAGAIGFSFIRSGDDGLVVRSRHSHHVHVGTVWASAQGLMTRRVGPH